MIKNLLQTTFRHLIHQRVFVLINLLGLVAGLSSVLYIALYIQDEFSYDLFHENYDRIVRVNQTFIWGDTDRVFSSTGPGVKSALIEEIPEFVEVTRFHQPAQSLVSYKKGTAQKYFDETAILSADENVFRVFTFDFLSGNPETCLQNPNSVVITASTAEKYFGEATAYGKTLIFGEGADAYPVLVTGVIADIPEQSLIQFDFLLSMSTYPRVKGDRNSWIWTTFVTFGLLHEEGQLAAAREKLPLVINKHLNQFLLDYRGMTYQEYVASGKKWELYFQPLSEVRLYGVEIWSRLGQVGDIKFVYIFGGVALLVLLVSAVNFINLTVSKSSTRALEIGMRKVMGASRGSLVLQYLVESIAYVLIAGLLAYGVVELCLPMLNQISGKLLDFSLFGRWQFWIVYVIGLLLLGMIAGAYPALLLTAQPVTEVMKSKSLFQGKKSMIRDVLIVGQFAATIALISAAFVVYDQVSFLSEMDLGFDRDDKLVITNVDRLGTKLETFVEATEQLSMVREVGVSVDAPPQIHDGDNFYQLGKQQEKVPVNFNVVDEHFVEIYSIDLVAGRNFLPDGQEKNKIIINESAARSFGWTDVQEALGKQIYKNGPLEIVAVMKDFSYNYEKILPEALIIEGSDIQTMRNRTISIALNQRLSTGQWNDMHNHLRESWYGLVSNVPFQYHWLDQKYQELFMPYIRFGDLLLLLALLSVLISILGLVGVLSFVIARRQKEIGMRKVLGASAFKIMQLLFGQFAILLAVGFVFGVPVSWWAMNLWLSNFEQVTHIGVWPFLSSGLLMLLILTIVVGLQTYQVANENPVEKLKDE